MSAALSHEVRPKALRKGEVGGKIAAGEVVTTRSGRYTTPFPKINVGTKRRTANTVTAVDRWLMENALIEAEARGDRFNAAQIRHNLDKPSQSDKDWAEEYLFGDHPPAEAS